MAFGQASGPPASHTQMRRLTELLGEAGHSDFRDARGPLGLNQRQASGKFTRDEAEALIEQLEAEADAGRAADNTDADADADGDGDGDGDDGKGDGEADETVPAPRAPKPARAPAPRVDRREAEQRRALTRMPTELLAAELQKRGWIVIEP